MIPALSLLNPWMLAGLVLAGIPILIHLLFRRRYQEVRWAAVLFLQRAVKRNAQRHRLQQILLLVLRTLAIAVLVLGLARPLLDVSSAGSAGRLPTHHLFVLDGSLSMRCVEGEQSRFETAKNAARRVVRTAGPSDSFQLVVAAGRSPRTLIARSTTDRDEVLRALDAATCSPARGDTSSLWPAVRRLLDEGPSGAVTRRVYLLSDFQNHEWRAEAGGQPDLDFIAEQADMLLVDVKQGFAGNLCVTDPRVQRGLITTGTAVSIEAAVRNLSDQAVTDGEVRLTIDGRIVGTETVSLEPFSRATVRFEYRPAAPGELKAVIESDEDKLSDDNRARLLMRVRDEVPVLLVNGRPSSQEMGGATDYLRLSLDPGADRGWNTPYRVRVASEAELGSITLTDYALVFLCNVRQVTADEAARFRQYVYSGGGLILCAGDQTDRQNYNSRLLGRGGLLPIALEETVGDATAPQDAFTFDSTRLEHPLLAAYRGNPGHGLELVLTFQYIRAKLLDETGAAEGALWFANGDPAIIVSQYGAGTAALVTIAGDKSRWSTWNTTSGTYASLMNELAEYSLARRGSGSDATSGESWSHPIAGQAAGRTATAVTQEEQPVAVRVEQTQRGAVAVMDRVPEPGFVRVQSGDQVLQVAVNTDPIESDLRGLTEAGLRESRLSQIPFRYEQADVFEPAERDASDGGEDDASLWLFVLVLGLLMCEQLVASRGRRAEWIGFAACAGVIALLVGLPTRLGVPIAATAVIALIVTGLLYRRRGQVRATGHRVP